MWKVIACSLVVATLANNVLIPSSEFSLENGKIMVIQAVHLKEKNYVESKLGCDITCSQMCLDLSRNYALAQCFKYCGCGQLIAEKNDSITRPILGANTINTWQDVRIDLDLPKGPNDPATIDAYLPTGRQGAKEKYSIVFKPQDARNGKEHLTVDLPGGPVDVPELNISASEESTPNSTKGKLEWQTPDPRFDGEYESVVVEEPNHYGESNIVRVPGAGFEAGVEQNYNFNPQTGEISYDEVAYSPDFTVQNTGTESINGSPGNGSADVNGTLSWDLTKNAAVNAIKAPESSSSGISTLVFQGFFLTAVGAVIYRFMTVSRSVAPASESLLTPYQRL